MSADDSKARRAWQRRLLFVAGFAAAASACGRSVSGTDGTAGTAASMAGRGGSGATGGAGGTGGRAGAGGGGNEPSTGGTGDGTGAGGDFAAGGSGGSGGSGAATGGTGDSAGAGGEAEAPLVNPTECVEVASRVSACEGCRLVDAVAMRCPSPLVDIEAEGSSLLVEHAAGSSLLKGANLWGFEPEDRFVSETWPGLDVRRELATNADALVVVHEAGDGVLLVSPSGGAELTLELSLGRLLDVGFEADTLHVLGLDERELTLHSVAPDGSVSSELVSDDASAGRLVRGSSPPRVVTLDGAGSAFVLGSGELRAVSLPSPIWVESAWFSAAALGERLLLGSLASGPGGTGGVYLVEDDGAARSFGNSRTLRCPDSYTAFYPDICEFEQITPVTTPGAVLAAELVVYADEPWLVSILGDVTDTCRTSVDRCFESRPCDCTYSRAGSTRSAVLKLENLDDPSRVLRIELGDFPYETVQLAASSGGGVLFVAVAEGQFTSGGGSHAGALIDYLFLLP